MLADDGAVFVLVASATAMTSAGTGVRDAVARGDGVSVVDLFDFEVVDQVVVLTRV